MTAESRFYSVQPLNPDGSKDGTLLHTDAVSAQQAAEKVLATNLALHGRIPRASVWTMNESFAASTITFYLVEPADTRS